MPVAIDPRNYIINFNIRNLFRRKVGNKIIIVGRMAFRRLFENKIRIKLFEAAIPVTCS